MLQRRICVPLALNSTYLYSDPSDKRPVDPMSGTKKIHIPRLMSSQFSEGGLVMTSRDAMRFTRAFFDGHLFDTRFLAEMMHWVPARPFLDYGLGLQRLRVPWWRALPTRMSGPLKNVFRPGPRVIGHFGLGGTFAIYEPRAGVVAAGTVNQFSDLIHGVIFALRAIEYHRRDRQSLIRSMQCAGADMPHDPMPMDRAE